jgi:hypothetical protein
MKWSSLDNDIEMFYGIDSKAGIHQTTHER